MKPFSRWVLFLALLIPCLSFGQAPDSDALIVDELACRGNAATSCEFILGHLYLAPGERVDEEELGNARLRLASLPSFHHVDIYLEKGRERDHVRVVIEVAEADPYVREWLAGTSARLDSVSELLAGRITHQNLFGRGKLLDVSAIALVPVDGIVRSEYGARVQYVDPHLFDSKRLFLVAGLGGGHSDFETIDGSARQELNNVGIDVRIGRRLFDFSYFSVLYRHNPLIDLEQTIEHPDGRVEHRADSFDNHVFVATYGWNSEDDPYFPTRGSRAYVSWIWANTLGGDGWQSEGGFRKTWTTQGGTSWLIQISDTPGTEYRNFVDEGFEWMAGIARPLRITSSDIRRARWYVEAGYSPRGHSARGERLKEYGLKVGLRLETRAFGLVDLYIIGSGLHSGGAPE